LAHVADRPARTVRREARDERGVLAPVALSDADDQLLADVAREVEVDVGDGRELAVQEAPERELVRDRIDVREPGEVTDDRSDRAPPSASGREEAPRRVGPAHLVRAFPCDLEYRVVEEEEASEPELVDERELAFETRPSPCVARSIARVESGEADGRELADSRIGLVREVRVTVAQLLRQVELEPLGEERAPLRGRAVAGEALEHLLGRPQVALAVATALRLAALERGAAADRDQDVL